MTEEEQHLSRIILSKQFHRMTPPPVFRILLSDEEMIRVINHAVIEKRKKNTEAQEVKRIKKAKMRSYEREMKEKKYARRYERKDQTMDWLQNEENGAGLWSLNDKSKTPRGGNVSAYILSKDSRWLQDSASNSPRLSMSARGGPGGQLSQDSGSRYSRPTSSRSFRTDDFGGLSSPSSSAPANYSRIAARRSPSPFAHGSSSSASSAAHSTATTPQGHGNGRLHFLGNGLKAPKFLRANTSSAASGRPEEMLTRESSIQSVVGE